LKEPAEPGSPAQFAGKPEELFRVPRA
jgi:hypothetical protein